MSNEIPALYVGADDSNHAGDSKGEIVVFTFSLLFSDSVTKDFSNRRNIQQTQTWLSNPKRDYLFSILMSEKFRHSNSNLVYVAPNLIGHYLDVTSNSPKILKIYLDGHLSGYDAKTLREQFHGKRGIESVVIDNFVKKTHGTRKGILKRPHCPPLVYHADIIAHDFYSSYTFENLTTHKKLVSIL